MITNFENFKKIQTSARTKKSQNSISNQEEEGEKKFAELLQ